MERGRKRTAAVSQWDARQAPPTPNISCHVFPQPLLENVSLKPVVERVKKGEKTLRNEKTEKTYLHWQWIVRSCEIENNEVRRTGSSCRPSGKRDSKMHPCQVDSFPSGLKLSHTLIL